MVPLVPRGMMKPLIYCFAALAAIGLVLSIASHLAALQAKSGPLGNYTWTLHLGALAVCVPAAIVARRLRRGVAEVGHGEGRGQAGGLAHGRVLGRKLGRRQSGLAGRRRGRG